MNELLELKGITAGYEHTVVLRDVNLSIREHDFIGIIGPNGGGKTTLLKVILGLLKPFSGEIVYHVSKQSLFGYLPQNSRFDARFPISVKEVVLSGLMSEKGIFKDYTKADREKVDELLETYGMGGFGNRPIGELSGGQMQRVFLCRAIISSPKILILDDSTSAVDTKTDALIRKAFREEIPGTTKIIIAQRISSVQDADRILVLDNGQINGLGTHEELLKNNAIYQEVYNSQTQGGGDFDKQGGEQ